jgi:tRNA (mo5U34)-methyltransferase
VTGETTNGPGAATPAASIEDRYAAVTWYHTLELPGERVTEGIFDLRPYVDKYGLPERMDGMRVLEVGTWDGFWAFEFERRGATVTALDVDEEENLDWPPRRRPDTYRQTARGSGFVLAKEMLASKVERVNQSIYETYPEDLGGTFDLVFCGSVIMHLRDQLLALERIAGLCHGTFISAEEYDRRMAFLPFPASRYLADREASVVFWLPNARAWKAMLWTAGFDDVQEHGRFKMQARAGWSVPHVVHHAHMRQGS